MGNGPGKIFSTMVQLDACVFGNNSNIATAFSYMYIQYPVQCIRAAETNREHEPNASAS